MREIETGRKIKRDRESEFESEREKDRQTDRDRKINGKERERP